MDKSEIVRKIYDRKKTNITMKDLAVVVDEVFVVIGDSLQNGEKVDISNFGTFDVRAAAIKPLERFARTDGRKKAKT